MNEHPTETTLRDDTESDSLSVWKIVKSVLAAGFGVQSSHNRNRDFSKGKPRHFIAVGIILTIAFVIAIIVLVNLVLANVGAHS